MLEDSSTFEGILESQTRSLYGEDGKDGQQALTMLSNVLTQNEAAEPFMTSGQYVAALSLLADTHNPAQRSAFIPS